MTSAGPEPAAPAPPAWDATLTLDPDALPDPLAAPGARDVLVCGASRSGTTLLSAMLFQPPGCVAVMEPWDALRLAPGELFASLRAELRGGALLRGHLDVATLRDRGAVLTCTQREAHVPVACDDDHVLAVKCPALWRYLERLPATRFVVCLRDPREVVASCVRSPGRLAAGLDYDVPFNRELNRHLLGATDDSAVRRVLLYDYVYERILPHLGRREVFAVRYERWFTEPDLLLAELGAFLETDLSRPLARVRAPRNRPAGRVEDEVAALVREHCRTADALGYPGAR
ncbi:MAG TPA: sulfotransferase [Solirubrobacteraceae bacterium]|nr:sulfotransferase [Solirubrobacteraceae bacterium]